MTFIVVLIRNFVHVRVSCIEPDGLGMATRFSIWLGYMSTRNYTYNVVNFGDISDGPTIFTIDRRLGLTLSSGMVRGMLNYMRAEVWGRFTVNFGTRRCVFFQYEGW